MVNSPIALLMGKEAVLRDAEISRIRQDLFKDPSSLELNQHRFDATNDTLADVLSPAQTAPFLAEKRLVIVDHVDAFSQKEAKIFLASLKVASSSTVWILMTDERKARSAFLKELMSLANVITCEAPYHEGEVKNWVRKRFSSYKKRVSSSAIDVLLERVGKDLTALGHAVENLHMYCKEKEEVSQEDAEALLGESAERNVFQLYDALKDRRLEDALKILGRLRSQGRRAHEILASLAWQFDRMLRIKNALAQGMQAYDIAQKFRMPLFFAKEAQRRARTLDVQVLKKDLGFLLECETSVKRGILREDLALERCVLSLYQA